MTTTATTHSHTRRAAGKRPIRRGPRRLKEQAAETTPAMRDYPYTMRLGDGRTVFVEIPGKWTVRDRSGEVGFLPPAVRFLDKLRALALSPHDRKPTPGYLATLRVALGLTQLEFGARLGMDKITVSRWERGATEPSDEALRTIDRLRRDAIRKGVVIPE